MKTCRGCEEARPLSEFGKHAGSPDGLRPRCKACTRAEGIAYRAKNAERNAAALAEGIPDGDKECTRCGVSKPYSEFQRRGRSKDGFAARCRDCHSEGQKAYAAARPEQMRQSRRRRNLKEKYGMEPAQYDELLIAQDGRCAICRKLPTSENSRFGILYVDHDHATGAIRGLLCDQCNRGIGLLQDSPDTLMAAAAYLLARQTTSGEKEKADA